MIFWSTLLVVYILISIFIDTGKLPSVYLRHVWNFIPFALGMYFVYRTRIKQRMGYVESLESRIEELATRYESLKYNSIAQKLQAIEARLLQLENKLKG